jgi:hypothetical protein
MFAVANEDNVVTNSNAVGENIRIANGCTSQDGEHAQNQGQTQKDAEELAEFFHELRFSFFLFFFFFGCKAESSKAPTKYTLLPRAELLWPQRKAPALRLHCVNYVTMEILSERTYLDNPHQIEYHKLPFFATKIHWQMS